MRIAVKTDSGITSIKDLNGKNVATSTGTTSVQALRFERAGGIDFKEVMGKDHAESFLLLETGKADAFVMDGSILAANISRSKNPKNFKIVGEVLAVDPIACMLPRAVAKFKAVITASKTPNPGSSGQLCSYKWFLCYEKILCAFYRHSVLSYSQVRNEIQIPDILGFKFRAFTCTRCFPTGWYGLQFV